MNDKIDHGVAIRSLERGIDILVTSLLWIEKDTQEYKQIRRAQLELYRSLAIIQEKSEQKD